MLFRGRVPSSASARLAGWSGLRRPRPSWASWWEVVGSFVGEAEPRQVVFARGQRPAVLRLLRASVASSCCFFVSCRFVVGGVVSWSSSWRGAARCR